MRLVPLLCLSLLSVSLAADRPKPAAPESAGSAADANALLERELAALAPQRPGTTDLYVLGFAGDGEENVFRNEVVYLKSLFERRFDARGHVVSLINHPDSLGKAPTPLATYDNLYDALERIGETMDREQDVLLLYLTMHGTEDHELAVQLQPMLEDWLTPEDLRTALDDAGIRNRVIAISACYSGGFVPALRGPDTLVVTAARGDRASFGCGTESEATYFGRAWLVDGLNRTTNFVAAYDIATREIARREKREGFEPSLPQIDVGARIGKRLQAWEKALHAGEPVPYPYAANERDGDAAL